jgi:hypothetical protein
MRAAGYLVNLGQSSPQVRFSPPMTVTSSTPSWCITAHHVERLFRVRLVEDSCPHVSHRSDGMRDRTRRDLPNGINRPGLKLARQRTPSSSEHFLFEGSAREGAMGAGF